MCQRAQVTLYNYNNYCSAFDQRNGFGYVILFLVRSKRIL